jgi:hypothetical protein
VSEGDIDTGRRSQKGTSGWAIWAAERIGSGISAEAVAREIDAHLHRRFGNPPPERPTNKALQEAVNDALAVAGFTARGLLLDATSIKAILRWGSELLITDQSRYVAEFPDCNAIWLAADLARAEGGRLRPVRRGFAGHGKRVADAIISAYRQLTAASESSLVSPYLPIHVVRAHAGYHAGVTRALVDIVLAKLVDGEYADTDVKVHVHIGTSALPNSEPAFRHHGRRRLEMTISTTDKEDL